MSIYLGSTFATFNYYSKNSDTALKQEAAQPAVARDTAYYEANIGSVTSVDDFVNNYRLLNYAMTAYGLSDETNAKALVKQVLSSDLSDSSSLVYKLNDQRYLNLAKAFANLNPNDSAASYTAATTQQVVNSYLEQQLETDVGQQDEGTQLALYFQRNAANIISGYSILGDSQLWKVVQTVYDLPESLGSIDINQQKDLVESKVNIADLQDPTKVSALLDRFSAVWDATNSSAASSDPVLELFSDGGSDASASGASSNILDLEYGG